MNPFDLPLWAKALIVAALVAAAGWAVHAYNESLRAEGRAEVQAKWDAEREKQTAAALAESITNAKETQRRLAAQKDAQDAHDKDIARARADAVAAAAVAGRLSSQLTAFTAAACGAASDSGIECNRETAGAAVRVLADLFRRADQRAGILGEVADARRASGLQCQREADSLTVKP